MTEEHGTILDIDTSDAVEPQAVEAGEYKVRCTGFRKDGEGNIVREGNSGNKYFIMTLDIPDEPASKGLSTIFSVPTDQMDPKQLNNCKWRLEVLKKAFGIQQINFDAMIGLEAYAMLSVRNDPQYGEQNEVQKFIAGA